MQVILLENIEKVGEKFEVVKVKDGYGRNYLIPQGKAIIANKTNLSRLDDYKAREAAKTAKLLEEAQAIAEKLQSEVLTIPAKAGTSGKIFGSVTNVQLAQVIKEKYELEIDRRIIEMPEEVKTLGSYTALVKLHPEITAQVNFEVVQD